MDISKCRNETCTLKRTCFRYMAEAGYYQSYGAFRQIDGVCDHYWKIDSEKELIELSRLNDF